MTSVTIRLEKDLEERLAEEAAQTGLRRSEIVKLAVRRWLTARGPLTAEERPQPVGEERYARVAHLIGKFDSGIPDLAERHDEHIRRKLKREQ